MSEREDVPQGEMIQVVLLPHLVPDFVRWLADRNGRLFRIPVGEDQSTPVYGVTPIEWGDDDEATRAP